MRSPGLAIGAKKVSSNRSRTPRRRSSVSTLNMSSNMGPPRTADGSFGFPPNPIAIRPAPLATREPTASASRSTPLGSPPSDRVCSTPGGLAFSPPRATTR